MNPHAKVKEKNPQNPSPRQFISGEPRKMFSDSIEFIEQEEKRRDEDINPLLVAQNGRICLGIVFLKGSPFVKFSDDTDGWWVVQIKHWHTSYITLLVKSGRIRVGLCRRRHTLLYTSTLPNLLVLVVKRKNNGIWYSSKKGTLSLEWSFINFFSVPLLLLFIKH